MCSFFNWVKASRPKTLVASVVPIMVGAGLFYENNQLNDLSFTVLVGCFLFISLIQIATNLANDYFDAKTGADNFRENAPERYVSSGKIDGKKVLAMVIFLLFTSLLIGSYTWYISSANWWFFPLGLLCISLAIFYTGGPYPLAYNGLGDLFVILFFGIVAVEGVNFLLSCANSVNYHSHLGSALSVGFLINNLLIVNNYRDYESDKKIKKNTTIVIFGKKFGVTLFFSGMTLPVIHGLISGNFFISLIIVPSVFSLLFLLKSRELKFSNLSLSFSALSVLLYGLCHLI